MSERTRCPLLHVHETELQAWYDAGWAYQAASEKPEFCIIEWPHSRDPVAPFHANPDARSSSLARQKGERV